MSAAQSPVLLRRLSAFLIRGSDALIILADLEELFNRDLDRGLPRWQARYRYASNTIASAYRIWQAGRPLLGMGAAVSFLDIKLGVRMLRKQPILTGVAALALGLGIPASLSTTHFVNAIMAPLPFQDSERIVGIRNWDREANSPANRSLHDFSVWRAKLTTFQAVAASRSDLWNVHAEDGRAEPVRGAEITASAFDILRVPPLLGRTLTAPDEVIDAPDVVVVGADLWDSRFGRDPEIVGKTIRIGGVPHTVIGVMPEGFLFPMADHLWLPLRYNPTDYQRGEGPYLQVFGRLADGISMHQARAEVEMVGLRMAAEYPDTHTRLRAEVVPMPILALGMEAGSVSAPVIYVAQLVSILLLMIMCGNVSIMILARTATRSGEIAVRTALGASRVRIVSQLFVESLVLALLATGLGLLAANWTAHQFQTLLSPLLPYWMDVGLGFRSVLLALGLGVSCAVVASMVPALKATGRGIQSNLQRSAGRGSGIRFGAGSTALIVTEVALSVGVLSIGAAQMRTVFQDTTGELGIELEHYLSAHLRIPSPPRTVGQANSDLDDFWNRVGTTQMELKRRIESEPGVLSVAMTRDLPGSNHRRRVMEVEGDIAPANSGSPRVAQATVDVDFFQDLGHPILDGRGFDSGDIPEERGAYRNAVIVNTTFVAQVLGSRRAIGRRIRYLANNDDPNPWYEIVGVVGSLAMNSLNPARDAGVYYPAGPGEINPVAYVIETGEDPAAFTPRLRAIAANVDPAAMIRQPMLLSDLENRNASAFWLGTLALVLLSGVAVLLSAAGLYALMSFTVEQRTREIGIRTALGAHPRSIIYMVMRRAAIQLALGVVLGAALGAWLLADVSQSPSIKPQNMSLIVTAVVVGTVLVGMLACLAPTLRGLRIQPTEALREG